MDRAQRVRALYALPLGTFTSARNAAAKEAAQDGDKELAAMLHRLRKPSSAAWLVNILVAHRRDEVEQVLELGASLRVAQAGLDRAQLQALGQQRQHLLAAVAHRSLEAAAELGHDVGPAALTGVEQTLRAALADPGAAAAVLTGRLVRTLEASGWDDVDLEGAVAGPFVPPVAGSQRPADEAAKMLPDGSATRGHDPHKQARASARERRAAEARLSAAREARTAAEAAAAAVRRRSERLDRRRDEVAASVADLEGRLAALHQELRDLELQADSLARETAEAALAETEADAAVEAAESSAAALSDPDA